MFIAISIALIYFVLVSVFACYTKNKEFYDDKGYLDISLKWIITNILSLVWEAIFVSIKYVVVVSWSILVVIGFFIRGVLEIGGPWHPYTFCENWFYGEVALFKFLWEITKFIINVLEFLIKGAFNLGVLFFTKVFIDPFKLLKKNWGKFFDKSFFTIGKKDGDKSM